MATYAIYGKHIKEWRDSSGKLHEPDRLYKALTYDGVRVKTNNEAGEYATREDAQEVLDKLKPRDDVAFEIRPLKK